MTNTPYIEFKKKRELGDILTDTFAFMRNEFKPFFSVFFKIVGPYLLVMIIALVLYMYYVGDQFNLLLVNNTAGDFNGLTVFGLLLFYLISIAVVYTMCQSTVLHYIKSYDKGKGTINFEDIKTDVYASFWSFVGMGFLVGICLFIGFVLCVLPGIYLYVPLSLTFGLLAFSNNGVGDAFSASFNLVKDHWWITFATLLIMIIIVYIASLAFAVPGSIYTYAKMGILSGEADAESMMNIFQDPVYVLFNILATIGQFMLNIISIVAGALIYFNLNEHKNFTGTYERIQNIGKSSEN